MLDFHEIAKKWQKKWEETKLFEADAIPERKKFFVTFPYPYLNGYLHVGHTYTTMRVEAFARYKRMQGFNVLFPQGWHATGSPIETAAKRVQENEQKQIDTLKLMGFTDKDLPAFKEPKHWIDVFSKAAEQDFRDFGISIDWRRNFITTDLNPRYSKFIQWQFNKLFEKDLVVQGEHPVVWCPKENSPVGDHARAEGEGEVPEQMVLVKFKLDNYYLPCATFRPETTFGVTNIWINTNVKYVEAKVDKERWIIAEAAVAKLKDQNFSLIDIKPIKPETLIGKECTNLVTNNKVPILPANFVSAENATGVVMSVPAHAPYDYIALKDVQENASRFNVPKELVQNIKLISLIKIKEFGDFPAKEICEKMNIVSQADKKLEEATKEIYKKEFHTGVLKEITGKYKGKTVQNAKEELIQDFVNEKKAALMFELPRPVVCRCLTKCHVKIVDDQWFLKYSDEKWKSKTMKALSELKLYPEKIRPQFEYVVDWLKEWACTREFGLGTKLPWDQKWVIESLSDSTVYMAFYTIVHLLKEVPVNKINDKLFDYVFLGKGNVKDIDLDKRLVERMREEFNYWYPVDFRNSGKDLVQNHLTFYIFNHVGIFDEKHWPAGIGVNGFVNVQKIKMSKSKGNFKTLRELVKAFSPDITRTAILASGEELADVDWDPDLAMTIKNKLETFYGFVLENYNKGTDDKKEIDKWMESQLHQIIKDATNAMELTLYRSTLMRGFFDLQRNLKWYSRRRAGTFNKQLINEIIEAQIKILTPFTPHYCEELWEKIGKKGFVNIEKWPVHDEAKINHSIDAAEQVTSQILEDISSVLKLAKVDKPKKITLFIADNWKYKLFSIVKEQLVNTRNIGEIIKTVMTTDLKTKGELVSQLVQKLVKDPSKIPQIVTHQEAELEFANDSIEFFKQEFNCKVEVVKEQNSKQEKAKQAMPGKPAILVE